MMIISTLIFIASLVVMLDSTEPPSMLRDSKTDTDIGVLSNILFPKCTNNLTPESLENILHVLRGMGCTCDLKRPGVAKRDDYNYSPGLGGHKFHTRTATFNEARKLCNEEGGHLAIINSLAEERKLLNIFKSAGTIKNTANSWKAYIGTHDMYKEGEWVTILGDSLYKSGYAKWSENWGGQPDNWKGNQNCGALVKDGGMDDVNCDNRYAFFCEIDEI